MKEPSPMLRLVVPEHLAGGRLDRVLDELVPELSRSRLQKTVRRGRVWLRGRLATRSNVVVQAGDAIAVRLDEVDAAPALPLLHADQHLLVVDKPAGMLAHATDRHPRGSVAERMAREHGPLPVVMGDDRPGVVHRLDRQTSGVMVLARTDGAMTSLRAQFRQRAVEKSYLALVHGAPPAGAGTVELPLEPHPGEPDRQRIAAPGTGKAAATRWELVEGLGPVSLLRCRPLTGRRHQIRVHLASAGLFVLGDRLYRAPDPTPLPPGAPVPARQALHAERLGFVHPGTGERVAFESPLAGDLTELVEWLRGRG